MFNKWNIYKNGTYRTFINVPRLLRFIVVKIMNPTFQIFPAYAMNASVGAFGVTCKLFVRTLNPKCCGLVLAFFGGQYTYVLQTQIIKTNCSCISLRPIFLSIFSFSIFKCFNDLTAANPCHYQYNDCYYSTTRYFGHRTLSTQMRNRLEPRYAAKINQ